MAELVIIIGQNKKGVLNGLKMKSSLETAGLEVLGIMTKETEDEKVPKELIESLMNSKVLGDADKEISSTEDEYEEGEVQ